MRPEGCHSACLRATSLGAGVSLRFAPVRRKAFRFLASSIWLRGFACAVVCLSLSPVSLHAEIDLAEARRLVLRGRYEEALEHYETSASAESPEAALGRARCYRETGRSDRAERLLQRALETHSEHPELRAELALLRLERGAWDAAGRDAAAVLERDEDHPTARWVTAELSRLSGQLDEAAEGYSWFIRRHAERPKWSAEHLRWVGLATAQHARWHSESEPFRFLVESFYPEFFERHPDYWPARLDRARLFLEKYNTADANGDLDAILAVNARAAELYVVRAQLALQQFDLRRVHEAIEQALALHPSLLAAHHTRADALLANLEPAAAEEVLQKAREVNPVDEGTLGRLAAARLSLADGEAADAGFERLRNEVTQRNARCGQFYLTVADSLDRMRKYPQAVAYYRDALRVMPRLMYARGQLGLVLMRLGEEDEAAALLAEAYRMDPFNVRVRNMLEVLDVLEGYAVRETEHFIVKYDGHRDALLGEWASRYLEASVYPEVVGALGYEPPGKTLIEIFCRARSTGGHGWFSARMTGLPFVGSVGACAGHIVAMVSPNDLPRKFDWARVLRHEFVHVVTLQQTNFNIPHWYTEALAVRFEALDRPAEWNRVLAGRLRSDTLFDLETINLGFIRPDGPDDWTLAYCQAELYAEYLVEAFGQDALVRLLEAYARNRSTPAALQDCFHVDPEHIESEYRAFLAEVVARSVSEDRSLPTLGQIRAALAERPEDAELWAQLAAVHLAGDRKNQAARSASAALRLESGQPLAGLVMARIHLDAGEPDAAIARLEESLGAEAPDLRVVVLLAELRLETQAFDQAERLYRIGERCQPDADLWPKSLARVYLKSGNPRKLTQVLDRLTRMEYDNLLLRRKLLDLARHDGDATQIRRWAESVLQIDVADAEAHAALAGLTTAGGDSAAAGDGLDDASE